MQRDPTDCGTVSAMARKPRKPASIQRTWALVITALVLYIPANLLPIMTMDYMGNTEADTIFAGVKSLFASGMWLVGLLIFCASITIPLMKLLGLAFLLISVQGSWHWRLQDRTRLYRVINLIGRWSMLDVFLLSILVGLVQLGNIATIVPGLGAYAFASVVVITMFATRCFDPRLIWDAASAKSTETADFCFTQSLPCHEPNTQTNR